MCRSNDLQSLVIFHLHSARELIKHYDKKLQIPVSECVDVPTQFPTQGQWWSNLAMQRLHTAQCLDLMGFRIYQDKVAKAQSACVIVSVLLCMYADVTEECDFYQTGAAEDAQIQAACLCQLHYCLQEGREKQKQDF